MTTKSKPESEHGGCIDPLMQTTRRVIVSDAATQKVLNRVVERQAYLTAEPVLRPPEIMTWESYLSSSFYVSAFKKAKTKAKAKEADFVLSSAQEHAVWQAIVRDYTPFDWSMSGQVASLLRSAWRVQNLWNISSGDAEQSLSTDLTNYSSLAKVYESELSRIRALDCFQLLNDASEVTNGEMAVAHGFFA